MYWPKFSFKKLIKLLARRHTKSGISCSYIRWTNRAGLKMYSNRMERDHSYRLQKLAEQVKLAPLTGKTFEFQTISTEGWEAPEPRVKTVYCYWTEHVIETGRYPDSHKLSMLEQGLADLGICHSDLRPGNVGYKGGRLLCFDFDPASCCAA